MKCVTTGSSRSGPAAESDGRRETKTRGIRNCGIEALLKHLREVISDKCLPPPCNDYARKATSLRVVFILQPAPTCPSTGRSSFIVHRSSFIVHRSSFIVHRFGDGARGRIRTDTGPAPRQILSLLRLPFRHSG